MVNTVAARACVGSIGEAVVLNGAPGGFLQRAAADRLKHGAAGMLPSQAPARATLRRCDDCDEGEGGTGEGDDQPDGGGVTRPPADMDISWVDHVPIGQVRGIRVKMQSIPS